MGNYHKGLGLGPKGLGFPMPQNSNTRLGNCERILAESGFRVLGLGLRVLGFRDLGV